MSVLQSGFSKRGPSSLSLNIAPRFPNFQINCTSSNKENYPEASTPQLPKKTPFNSKTSLSVKKSNFSAQQCAQEPESPIEISFDKESPAEFRQSIPKEPKSAMFRKKEAEMSFCGDKSPLVLDVGCASPLCPPVRDYNEELYKRAEEYLDSLHFVIVLPEDHRRRPFGNLRVSTAKVPSSEGASSEHNSPGLISPSIHTSSLFQRRSSSKKDSDCTPAKQKLALAKSPFYNCLEKGKRLFATEANSNKDGNTDIDEDSAFEKSSPLLVVTSLNAKFTGMSLRASRELSDSSATSLKLEEDSPLKIIV